MDGGFVAAPAVGFYNPGGSWEVENFGIAPDIEVEQDPKAVRQGRDPQLEKAVEVLMEQLRRGSFTGLHSRTTTLRRPALASMAAPAAPGGRAQPGQAEVEGVHYAVMRPGFPPKPAVALRPPTPPN